MSKRKGGGATITFTPWTKGVPPVGWHFASADRDPEKLRYWDGAMWSLWVHESGSDGEFERAGSIYDMELTPGAVWWRTLTAAALAWLEAEGAQWHGAPVGTRALPRHRDCEGRPVESAGLDRIIWRQELQRALGVSLDTVSRYLQTPGKLPPPDVALSAKKTGWRLSTLRAAGVNLPV